MQKDIKQVAYKFQPIMGIVVVLLIWQAVCGTGIIEPYLLPSPVAVVKALITNWGLLVFHAKTTLTEAMIGLVLGVLIGAVFALLMDRFNWLYRSMYPLLIISQTVPTVAIAPLLVIWFGYGLFPKVLLVIITTFFPISIGLLQGFRSVDSDTLKLFKTMKASRWQVMEYAKFPKALPYFFSNLRLSASYAIVGAVVAEWLGGDSGLGVYMNLARKSYAMDEMFAIIVVISALSLILIGLVDLLEKLAMPWVKYSKEEK